MVSITTSNHRMSASFHRVVKGSEILYTCIHIDDESYQRAIVDLHQDIYGFVVEGKFQPAEDLTLMCAVDWCLPIVEPYMHNCWVILKKHPSEVYFPMSDIVEQDHYVVTDYDIWTSSDVGLVAVVIETDED